MAVTVAKPAVKIPAKPVVPPAPVKLAVVPPVEPPAVDPAAALDPDSDEVADDAKVPRKTRKDFPTWEGFCDYKIDACKAAVKKWTERTTKWEEKKLHKDADVAEKKQKKADKLFAAFIKVQLDLGTPQATIDKMVSDMKKNLETQAT